MGWIAVVLNDSSGTGDCAAQAKQLEEIFAEAGREARVKVARGGDQIRTFIESAVGDGCEVLVAGGGDGTINTAASVLVDRDIPLGVLPLGTLNHFAKDLGIPLELEEAARVVLEGTECRVDVGEVNGRVFVNNSSLGVYPAIVRLRERYQATGLGKVGRRPLGQPGSAQAEPISGGPDHRRWPVHRQAYSLRLRWEQRVPHGGAECRLPGDDGGKAHSRVPAQCRPTDRIAAAGLASASKRGR